jgi:two-component system heavy metal sensor histidine kinase CusS
MRWRFPPSRQPLAIATRLAVLIAAVTVALLVAATLGMYWVFTTSLAQEDQRFLLAKLDVLRVILVHLPDNPMALEEEVSWEGGASGYVPFFARVLDAGGSVIRETPGMTPALEVARFPNPKYGATPGFGRARAAGRTYLLASGWSAPAAAAGPFRLQVALDTSRDEALLGGYRRALLAVLAAGVLAAVVGGVALARHGMRPLAEIARTVREVSSHRLDTRVGATPWPTELRELAAAFDAMLDRLEDAFARLSQFSANLAHELRTPIANLRGAAEVALSRTRGSDEYRELLASSLEEYDRLARMIDGLLFLARAESGEAVATRAALDAAGEVTAVCEFFTPLAEERGVRLLRHGNASVCADAILLRRALSNVLANAVQHTPAGGEVRVTVADHGGAGVEITVRDGGPGIPPAELRRVWDRFYRGAGARAENPQGSGLGLAIVRSIMELHGGRATISSDEGGGTTVMLRFPPPPGTDGRAMPREMTAE